VRKWQVLRQASEVQPWRCARRLYRRPEHQAVAARRIAVPL